MIQTAPRTTRPQEIFQGEDITLTIQTREDLSSATEIEFKIDTPDQITKTLTQAEVSNVTTSSFDVTLTGGDTESKYAGRYLMQYRWTDGSGTHNGKIHPNAIAIRESIFVNNGSGNDYS